MREIWSHSARPVNGGGFFEGRSQAYCLLAANVTVSWWGWQVLGLIFAGYVPLASQSPYPFIVYSVANYRPHLSHIWANMWFSRSQLSHFLFLWIDPFFLDWMKNTLLFFCNTNILVRLLTVNMKNCLTPKNPKMCDPILVTLLKMRPHYSQSGRENATPSSSTSH